MPCPWRKSCRPAAENNDDALPSPTSAPSFDSWRCVRFSYLWQLRRNTKFVILLMAMMEALKHGPIELVYAGTHGQPATDPNTDYGFAYTAAYILSYIYVCLFMIVFIPLFSWWIPESNPKDTTNPDGTRKHSKVECVAKFLRKINMVILPISIGVCLASYFVSLTQVFVYVDARPVDSKRVPKNSKKNWIARLLLVLGVAISFGLVTGVALPVLAHVDLARVKQMEYYVILIPIQINLGVLMGTRFQGRMERRIKAKQNAKIETRPVEKVATENAANVESEKAPLLVEV